MTEEDSPKQRQNSEFRVLQSIYGENLKDLRKKVSRKSWSPLNLSISLTPQRGSSGNEEVYVKVDLHVLCSENYPDEVPILALENSKGISQVIIVQLNDELNKIAHENKGEETIFQLCQHVEEFLHRHNRPVMKSFYDEMLRQQEAKKKDEEFQKQQELKRQQDSVRMEVEKRHEMLKTEARLQRERQQSICEFDAEDEIIYKKGSLVGRRHTGSIEINESLCDHKGTELIDFGEKKIKRGQCLRHIDAFSVAFHGIDTTSGELFEVIQWIIEKNKSDERQILNNLSRIEQEFNFVTKWNHSNLTRYLGYKRDDVGDKIVVHILKEFICGSSCNALYTSQSLKIDIDYLKYLAKGVLTALDFMHRNRVAHNGLKDTCVIVNEGGIIKVSDYAIHRKLLDLSNKIHGNYSRPTDIFDFGILVLQLLGFSNASGENPEVPTHLQSDLYDLLNKCFIMDEDERWTPNQLLNHQLFRKPIVHFSPQHLPHQIPMEFERNISPEFTNVVFSNSSGISQSRINNEFEILEHLGKGAFGDVLKAKNKLDGGCYAIKRIKLNPKNKTLNKKIVREVMLLSRLNHENVVRYYNSWIETTTIKEDLEEDSSIITTTTTSEPNGNIKISRNDELSFNDDIEAAAPPVKNIEISITYDSKSQATYDDVSSEDDDSSSDDDDPFMAPVNNRFVQDSDSDSIQFERNTDDEDDSSSKSSQSNDVSKKQKHTTLSCESTADILRKEDHLYIQMEFCEKSTLRTAIDGNLYEDCNRVWRLFREIVDGLAHIHLQGMIHRDLKPVNIFLDSLDHVKIGDFGLATTIAIRSKQGDFFGISKSHAESLKEDITDESRTGQVGTALYVAPEINTAIKVIYNQKVDIYSLGVILFEMCHKPIETGMERIKLLTKLRTKEVEIPVELSDTNPRAHFLIKWLLNHDISKRPSAQELLQSEHLPPPVLEERELQELVRHTLNNPQLKGYRYLISSCFKQRITLAQDITYDRDPTVSVSTKRLILYESVREACVKIFKQHGGQNLATPLLMPKSKYYEEVESCVKLMTHFGNIVSLPHNLRVPFARYVAWNGLSSFRRYSVERVYKEKKVFGFLPREFLECSFDIVTPNQGNLMSDAEVLYIVYEIINEFPGIRSKHFVIRLNHTGLFKAILLYCGLKGEHDEMLRLMQDIKDGKVPKSELQNFLISRGLSDSMINLMINFLHCEIEVSKASEQFQMITKKKSGEASTLATLALKELRIIVQNAYAYGVEFEFVIAPGLIYNIQQYSGMICQFVCELKKKNKLDNKEVVAAGGRYDSMISYYRSIMEQTNLIAKEIQQSAVGISISLDKLVQAVQKQNHEELPKLDALDAIVCSVASKELVKEKTKLLRSLWAAGVRCSLIEAMSIVEVQDQLLELGVSHAIILQDNDPGFVRVRSWDKDSRESFERFQEKRFASSEFMENIEKILKIRNENSYDNNQASNNLMRSESKTNYVERNDSEAIVDILLITLEKLSSNARRRYENQVRSQLDGLFQKLTGFTTVIAVNLDSSVIRTLMAFLEFESENQFWASVESCIRKHQKHKKYMNEICEEIWTVRMKKTNPIVVLYSLCDNFYKIII